MRFGRLMTFGTLAMTGYRYYQSRKAGQRRRTR